MIPRSLFRPAPVRTARVNIAWTLFQSFVIWSVALVGVPLLLLPIGRFLGWDHVPGLHHPIVAAVLFAAFSALNVATGITLAVAGRGTPLPLACPRDLVIVGPYRYVRNPMAIAGIGQGIAVGLWFGSLLILLYSLLGAVAWHAVARPTEERDLSTRFGRAYDAYRASVPLWWPRAHAFVAPAA